MINSVEIGKNYAIRLLEFYGGTKQNVNIIGITIAWYFAIDCTLDLIKLMELIS